MSKETIDILETKFQGLLRFTTDSVSVIISELEDCNYESALDMAMELSLYCQMWYALDFGVEKEEEDQD